MSIEQQINDLKFFNEKATKLENFSFTDTVFNQETGITISFKNEPQPLVNIQRRGPNDEAIDAFVLTFRFFIQDNEQSSFRNMAAIYEHLPISEERKEEFKVARKRLNDFLDSNSFLNIDGVLLPYRHILDTFVYGGLSHANEKKKKEYDLWMLNPFSNPIVTNEFVVTLARVFDVIVYVRNLNNEVIEGLGKTKASEHNPSGA
jgi:hypothetical protein